MPTLQFFRPRCDTHTTVPSNYLKINQSPVPFALELGAFSFDDVLPYFTILIVGHSLAAMLLSDPLAHLPHVAIWLSLTLVLTSLLLPRFWSPAVGIYRAYHTRG